MNKWTLWLVVCSVCFESVSVFAEKKKSEFEKCGETFFPPKVQSVVNLDFAWVYGTDLLTSKDPDNTHVHYIYTSSGSIKIRDGSGSCSLDPKRSREQVVAGWIWEAKQQLANKKLTSTEFEKIVAACRNVQDSRIHEALGLTGASNNGRTDPDVR